MIVDAGNMAAIKWREDNQNWAILVNFMADLQTEMATEVSYENIWITFTPRQ